MSTSTPVGHVALLEGDRVIADRSYEGLRHHAERIFETLDGVLADAGRRPGDLDLVACDVGPGSFTGVRVSVASAKGIAMGLGRPLVGVGSLDAMAAQVLADRRLEPGETLVVVLDAQKGEVFAAGYDAEAELCVAPWHVARPQFAASLGPIARPLLGGEIASALVEGMPVEVIGDPRFGGPSAAYVARRAHHLWRAGRASGDPGNVEPLYVRAPDATPSERR